MTKAEIVSNISDKTGIEKVTALAVVEAFMGEVRSSISSNQSVFLRGFGTFNPKKRAEKTGRNISKNTTIIIDYKTGTPSSSHNDQINNYAFILQQMGYANIEKYLIYTNDEQLVHRI